MKDLCRFLILVAVVFSFHGVAMADLVDTKDVADANLPYASGEDEDSYVSDDQLFGDDLSEEAEPVASEHAGKIPLEPVVE